MKLDMYYNLRAIKITKYSLDKLDFKTREDTNGIKKYLKYKSKYNSPSKMYVKTSQGEIVFRMDRMGWSFLKEGEY